jgi:hypothetical protein
MICGERFPFSARSDQLGSTLFDLAARWQALDDVVDVSGHAHSPTSGYSAFALLV